MDAVVAALERTGITKKSAVLEEKLGDLYLAQGKPSSSVIALQAALALDPTPQQRVRLMLALANQLPSLGRDAEAYQVYQDFLKRFPDYPNPGAIYRPLRDLAEKLGRSQEAEKYQREIDRLTPPRA